MAFTLNPEAQSRLDQHLDAVEGALATAGSSRDQRRAVVDDLEAHIREVLAARSPAPTIDDVNAVLATLDPPAAYGDAAHVPARVPAPIAPPPAATVVEKKPKRSSWMKTSAIVALVVCGALLVMTPAIIDHLHERDVVALVTGTTKVPEGMSFNIPEAMNDTYRFGLWFTGSGAVLLGAIGAFVAFARERRA